MSRRNRRGRERRTWDDDDRSGWSGRRKARDRRPRVQPPRVERVTAPEPPPAPLSLLPAPVEVRTCGRCAEWLADEAGGRGECLHPGSGILKPWWDTPACDFFR